MNLKLEDKTLEGDIGIFVGFQDIGATVNLGFGRFCFKGFLSLGQPPSPPGLRPGRRPAGPGPVPPHTCCYLRLLAHHHAIMIMMLVLPAARPLRVGSDSALAMGPSNGSLSLSG